MSSEPLPAAPEKGQSQSQPAHTSESDSLGLFTTLARTGIFLAALQRECLGEHRLTFTEYSVLRLLQRAPEQRLTPSVLAEKIICTTGAMTKLVDRLQRGGLVERAPDPADRRGVRVEITRDGEAIADQAAETYRVGRERVLDRFDDRESDRIHEHLIRLLGALEADRANQ
jgi:DNA-binding MarR family transcriptional regulator